MAKEVKDVKDVISVRELSREKVYLAGREVTVSGLAEEDVKLFTEELDRIVNDMKSPTVATMVAEHSPEVLDMIRLINKETGQGFGGALATGNELTLGIGSAPDFERAGTQLSNWERSVSTGTIDWLFSESNPLTTGEQQGLIIIGVIDPVETPKIDQVQLTKNNDTKPIERLTGLYERRDFGTNETPVHEFREPWIIPPENTFYSRAHCHTSGSDKLQPISFVIQRARDDRTLGGATLSS